jgi:phosphoribosylaminoimidazole-succinocarboxamide synthase
MVRRRQLFEGDQMRIVLADEISPDNCRLWDAKTDEKLNIDRFRRDMDMIAEGYQEVTRRLGILPENSEPDVSGPRLVK